MSVAAAFALTRARPRAGAALVGGGRRDGREPGLRRRAQAGRRRRGRGARSRHGRCRRGGLMSSLEAGLVGLPNSGKSTVFNALTGAGAAVAPHMFSTVETNHAEADVRDPRLADLARLSASAKVVPATLRVVDIAGLVRGASHGEGLGNQFLGQIRSTDAVLHVVRCFRDETVAHPGGERRSAGRRRDRGARAGVRRPGRDRAAATSASPRWRRAATATPSPRARRSRRSARRSRRAGRRARPGSRSPPAVDLLTAKPTLYLANVDDSGNAADVAALEAFAAERGAPCIPVNAKIEAELRELPEADARAFLRRPRDRVARARPPDAGHLRAARPDPVLHDRPQGDARLDDPARPERAGRRRPHPHRPRPRVHPRRGHRVGPARRGRLRGRGQAPRLGAGRGARLRRRGRRHPERPLQRVTAAREGFFTTRTRHRRAVSSCV